MECPICSFFFNETENCPRLLSCGHTCCEQCLSHVIENFQITCPTCRGISHTISSSNLPKNYIVLEFIQNNNRNDLLTSSRTRFPEFCEQHPDEKVIRFCLTDSQNTCAECILDHSGHRLIKLDDPILELRFEIKGLSGKIEFMLETLSSKRQELQTKYMSISNAEDVELQRVDSHFKNIQDLLEQRRNEVRAKVQKEVQGMQLRVSSDIQDVNSFLSQIQDYLQNLQILNKSIDTITYSEPYAPQLAQYRREVHMFMSQAQRLCMLDTSTAFSTRALFSSKPLEKEIQKFGMVSVGDDIPNPAIYCFGTSNTVLKFNLSTQRWSQHVITETGGYEFKNFSSLAALPNGSIVITGGTKSSDVYEYKDNQIIKRCNMLHIRSSHNAIYSGGFIYCIGGYNGTSWHDKVEKISVETYTSVPIANLNHRRCAFSSCISDKSIYVIGGYDGTRYLDNIEKYSIAQDQWEVLPCILHRPLQNTGAVCYGENKLMIAGGYNEKGTLSVVRSLDLDSLEWTTMPSMQHTRYLMNKFHYYRGNVYAIGGSAQGQNIEYFSVMEGRWISVKSYKDFTDDTMYKWAAVISQDYEGQ